MKQITLTLIIAITAMVNIQAQKYFSKTGEVSFFSTTAIEDIQAVSNSATTVYDSETGKIQWAVLIKSFEFEKALMQEHFNENYMESSKFPKATFKGVIKNFEGIQLSKDGNFEAQVNGTLEIHGVTREVSTIATFKVDNRNITATCNLKVAVADYGIEVPSVVKENIAKQLEIRIKANYEVLDKS